MNYLKRPSVQIIIIAVIGLLAYSNTFDVPFLFDDETSITDNPVVRDLGRFLGGAGFLYNPRRFVGYLTVALNYRLGGLHVTGYHIFNLAVHVASACLVYALARVTLATPFFRERSTESGKGSGKLELLPFVAALLFVAHPVQTQAVTYIIQRLASLATMLYLLALVLYVTGRVWQLRSAGAPPAKVSSLPGHSLCFVTSLLCAILAMMTKETAFTLPLMVLLYESCFFGISLRRWLRLLAPVSLLLPVLLLSLLDLRRPLGQLLTDVTTRTRLETDLPRLDYLFTQFRVIVTYLRLLVFPAHQNLDYDHPLYHTFWAPPVFLSLLLLLALLGAALYLFAFSSAAPLPEPGEPTARPESVNQRHEARVVAFGILWFFIALSIESSLIPIADVIFEHRVYLPSVGASLAAAALFCALMRSRPGKDSAVGVASLVLILAALTWQRNEVWRDGLTLWEDVARKSPGKARPHVNLGSELMRLGRTDEAIEHFRAAARIKPDYGEAYSDLAAAYNMKGRFDEAIEQCAIALRIDPDNADALSNVGTSFALKGQNDYAIAYFQAALQLRPDNTRYRHNLSLAARTKESARQ